MGQTLDDQIDALYQLPLDQFTPARNALAKTAGDRAEAVRKLAKPKAAAWAINQLFWKHRPLFDRVVKTSTDARRGHVARLGGKSPDLQAIEASHEAALHAARQQITAILESAGAASPPTLTAVDRTLAALPSPEVNGRLTEPIESVGFGLLSGLLEGGTNLRELADVVSLNRASRSQPTSTAKTTHSRDARAEREREKAARAEAAERKRERQRLQRELDVARARESEAAAAFADARKAVAKADARIEKLETELREARQAADRRREALDSARATANDAAAERVRRERALNLLGD